MKVLLTGANGFVASHVLDRLRIENVPTVLILRPGADTRFIAPHLTAIEVHRGSLTDAGLLRAALREVTHVVHCAGATKALSPADLFAANEGVTASVVQAVNDTRGQVQRLVHLSSLAAGGPGTTARPAREGDPPAPLSGYGRSKLAAEQRVMHGCATDWVVLRPAGVYGPRDAEFLRLFKAVRLGLAPLFGGGRQELSLAYAPDVAGAVFAALTAPSASRQIINTAAEETTTAGGLVAAIAAAAGRHPLRLPLPAGLLRGICAGAGFTARLTRRPTVLAHGKHRELTAPGWVCDTTRLRDALGPVCRTPLARGLAETAAWYRREGWW